MKIEMTNEQWHLLLAALGKAHLIAYLMDKDVDSLDEIITILGQSLDENGKREIFDNVFTQVKR